MVYGREGCVSTDMIDAKGELSVAAVFRLAENGVTELMGKLKIDGITAKKIYGAMWVFSKNAIRLIKPLPWGEGYRVESFITAYSIAKLIIETAVKDLQGAIVAYAKTELCALDLQTGRIRKTSSVGIDGSFEKHAPLMDTEFGKFCEDGLKLIDEVRVRSCDIDFSRHTNNVEYVKFILNTYSVNELLCRPVKQMEIFYINQSFENDKLQVYKFADGSKDFVEIKKGDTAIVRCCIEHYAKENINC